MTIETTAGPRAPQWGLVAFAGLLIAGLGTAGLGLVSGAGRVPQVSVALTVPVSRPVPAPVEAAPAPAEEAGVVRVALDARALLALFQDREYRVDEVRAGQSAVPRLILSDLPTDLGDMGDIDERKRLFVKALLPMILTVNEDIARDRDRLDLLHRQKLAGNTLAPKDRFWLSALAERYGVAITGEVDTGALLAKVDEVPPSLALAQAVEESGWGTSRFAQDGNALFGQLTWRDGHDGIVPRNRRQGETHRFRAFEDPLSSVQAYVHNLNTHGAYREFRWVRAGLRKQDKPLDGYRLAGALERYSERGQDYIRAIRSVMRSNGLTDFDKARLDATAEPTVVRASIPAAPEVVAASMKTGAAKGAAKGVAVPGR